MNEIFKVPYLILGRAVGQSRIMLRLDHESQLCCLWLPGHLAVVCGTP